MSLGRTTGVVPVSREDYARNLAQLEMMQQKLDQWRNANDMGLATYEQTERELQQQLESEELAANQTRQRLLELRNRTDVLTLPSGTQGTSSQPAVPNSARIQEIPSANNTPTRGWSHNVPTAGHAPMPGSIRQAEYGRNPYQQYYPPLVAQRQTHTQQNLQGTTSYLQGALNVQGQTMNSQLPFSNVLHLPVLQPPQNTTSYLARQTSSSNVIQQPVPQTPQDATYLRPAQTSSKSPATTATHPVNVPDQTSRIFPTYHSSSTTKGVAVPMSQTLSGTHSNTSSKQSQQLTKMKLFQKHISEWAKSAPQKAFCSTSINGIELFPYKENTSAAKRVGVMVRDPQTSQYRDITSVELEDILEGRFLPTRTSKSTATSQPHNSSTSAQSSSNSVIPPPTTPTANGATPNPSVQSGTPQRTPAQANKATIARDVLRLLGKPSGVLPPLNLQPQNRALTPKQQALRPESLMPHAPSDASQTITAAARPNDGDPTEPTIESQTPPSTHPTSNAPNENGMQASVPGQKGMDIIILDASGPQTPAQNVDTSKSVDRPMVEDSEPIKLGNPFQVEITENQKLEETVQDQQIASGSFKSLDSTVLRNHHTPSSPPRPRTPLFLSSPEPSSLRDASSPEFMVLKNPRIRNTLDYVEIPPAPEYVKEDRERLRQSKRRKVEDLFDEDHETAQTSLAALVQGAYAITPRSPPGSQRNAAEEAVMKDATTRLQYSPCRWRPCDAVMNSIARLERHLRGHVENMDDCEVVNCLWQDCGRSQRSKADLIAHVIQHVRSSLPCPYEDCENTFRTSRQLSGHCSQQHTNEPLKPSADPVPSRPSTPPECPNVLPSYMVVARRVSHHPMTRERHQSASAAVLKRIMPRTHTIYGLKRSQLKRRDAQTTPPLEDDYDFVAYRASPSYRPSWAAKIQHLPDLKSSEISTMVHNGLTLWKGDDQDVTG